MLSYMIVIHQNLCFGVKEPICGGYGHQKWPILDKRKKHTFDVNKMYFPDHILYTVV